MMHGQTQFNAVSRFIREVPPNLLDTPDKITGAAYEEAKELFSKTQTPPLRPSYTLKTSADTVFDKPAAKKAFDTNAGGLDYDIGDRVWHIKFGSGTVQEIIPAGRDYEVAVEFQRCGVKRMFASFAKLKKEE
jgi:DNA helicase-2/ATP-dependent DNA helicase PcrA